MTPGKSCFITVHTVVCFRIYTINFTFVLAVAVNCS